MYAIGILGDEDHPKRAKKALQIIAERTGGIAFFPSYSCRWPKSPSPPSAGAKS